MYETIKGEKLCDPSFLGSIAVCWDEGCTYKNARVHFGTPMDGTRPGRVYVCGGVINR